MDTWIKSSYSHANGGACVEVAASWRKSTYSHANGGDCVEVANSPETVKIRDTRHRHHGHLTLPAGEWAAFLSALRRGEL